KSAPPPEASPQNLAPSASETSPLSIDVSAETLGVFTTRVQPILMNACASCHATGRGGAFKLTRAFEGATIARRSTQHNLAAVMAQVDIHNPEASPLLIKAVSVHGANNQPPLKGRQSPPFRMLEEWVRMALASNPHRKQQDGGPPPETKTVAAATVPPELATPKTSPQTAPVVSFKTTAVEARPGGEASTTSGVPSLGDKPEPKPQLP